MNSGPSFSTSWPITMQAVASSTIQACRCWKLWAHSPPVGTFPTIHAWAPLRRALTSTAGVGCRTSTAQIFVCLVSPLGPATAAPLHPTVLATGRAFLTIGITHYLGAASGALPTIWSSCAMALTRWTVSGIVAPLSLSLSLSLSLCVCVRACVCMCLLSVLIGRAVYG